MKYQYKAQINNSSRKLGHNCHWRSLEIYVEEKINVTNNITFTFSFACQVFTKLLQLEAVVLKCCYTYESPGGVLYILLASSQLIPRHSECLVMQGRHQYVLKIIGWSQCATKIKHTYPLKINSKLCMYFVFSRNLKSKQGDESCPQTNIKENATHALLRHLILRLAW